MMEKTAGSPPKSREENFNMKRFLSRLLTGVVLTMALCCVAAAASDFDAAAKDLSSIGMLRGTANGSFELDRAPTRSEAAIMLVRLYGAEEQAKADFDAGKLQNPFTDVSQFTAPYVAWLHDKGIANGTGATTFGAAQPCTLQNYAVFLLRALGYQDGKDFQYADALSFAQSKGFYSPVMFSGSFLRDDLAALTYQALAADMADGKTYLLDSLIRSGAVDAAAAKPMTEKIQAYRSMENAMQGVSGEMTSMDMDMNMKMKMDMTVAGQTEKVSSDTVTSGNVKVVMNGSDIQMAYDMNTKDAEGSSVKMGMWLKDGWFYTSMIDGQEELKYKFSMDASGLSDLMGSLQPMEGMQAANVSGLAMLDSITSKKSGGDTVYTLTIGSGMSGMMEGLTDLMGEEAGLAGLHFGDILAEYTVGSNGQLKAVRMVFSAGMNTSLPLEDGKPAQPVTLDYDYDMTMKVNAVGSSVKITFPDLSTFPELDLGDLARAA